jgi:hypothetical protein
MADKTPWYPASIKPVRVGMYEVNSFGLHSNSIFFLTGRYRWWNGSEWKVGSWASSGNTIFGSHPSHLWRGLSKDTTETLLVCPSCGSDNCTVTAEQAFMVNTGDHFCHSVKTQDSDAKASCLDCHWSGRRDQLKENK